MEEENKLGNRIKVIRKSLGLTQEKLAELANIDNKHLSKIENGAHLPSFKTIEKLSLALGVDITTGKINSSNITNNNSKFYFKCLQILNSSKDEHKQKLYYQALKLINQAMD